MPYRRSRTVPFLAWRLAEWSVPVRVTGRKAVSSHSTPKERLPSARRHAHMTRSVSGADCPTQPSFGVRERIHFAHNDVSN